MLNVLLTVDVEIWPTSCAGDRDAVRAAMDRNIYGRTPRGDYGLPHQLARLKEHNLKAVFLVESLFALAVGREYLQEIVDMIVSAGQEVQLHLHSEWLSVMPDSPLPGRTGRNMHDFSEDEQARLIEIGLENLADCGVTQVSAFRAGNYGADFATLRALARNGLRYDTSYNQAFLGTECKLETPDVLLRPLELEGICEVPVSLFDDRSGRYRPTQLAACSSRELVRMMEQALGKDWPTFVIVSHGFELLNSRRNRADPIMIRRFDAFCRYLADNRDKLKTVGFRDLELTASSPEKEVVGLVSGPVATAVRMAEQIARYAW